ncbi:MAG: RHS repeat domain-containing protein, partial [Anaerolineales bacterium]
MHRLRFRQKVSRTVDQRPDPTCRLEAVFAPASQTAPILEYTYDSLGRVKEARDAIAVATPASRNPHRFFIAEGFRVEREDPLGGRYAVETLRNGRETRHIDEMGRATTSIFDGRGRVLSRTAPWGDVTSFTYDARDNVLSMTHSPRASCGSDPTWCQMVTVSAQYHATWNRPTRITLPATAADPSVRHWDFTYNSNGLLSQ